MIWILWALAAAALGAAAVVLFAGLWLWRTPLRVHGRASGGFTRPVEAEGFVSFRPFTVSPERQPDGKLALIVRFRSRVLGIIPLEPKPEAKESEPRQEPEPLAERIETASRIAAFVSRYWGFGNLAAHLLGCRRFIEAERFTGFLEYGFEDPSVTGRIYGHQCEFRAVTDRLECFHLVPVWQPGDHLDGELDAVLSVYPVRMAGSILWFLLSRFRWRLLFAGHRDHPAAAQLAKAERRAA